MLWQESTKIRLVVGLVVSGILIVSIGLTKGWQVFGSLVPTFAASTREVATSDAEMAPEFAPGNWINSEPLTLKGLNGRVVLVEFWTFGCYNCRNTLPFVKSWHDRYASKGLTIVGVHSPELDDE